MAVRQTNIVNRIEDGIAYLDVSTKKFPNSVALVDVGDLHLVLDGGGKWGVSEGERACLYVARKPHKAKKQYLHRHILGLSNGDDVVGDHRNHCTFDNRKSNLRVTTRLGNARNSSSTKGSTSKYLGVSWYSARRMWRATITVDRQWIQIGVFRREEDAAVAYDKYAHVRFGEFANLNFPDAIAA